LKTDQIVDDDVGFPISELQEFSPFDHDKDFPGNGESADRGRCL
jgi:hypothetical protein